MKVDIEKELELVKVDIVFADDGHSPLYMEKQVSLHPLFIPLCLILGFDISGAQLGFDLSNAYKIS